MPLSRSGGHHDGDLLVTKGRMNVPYEKGRRWLLTLTSPPRLAPSRKTLGEIPEVKPGPTTRLSPDQVKVRRQRLDQLAAEAEELASNPREATYQSFERILKQAVKAGTSPSAMPTDAIEPTPPTRDGEAR